ncbi:MAG: septum formation initiator family protein, partial [Pseudomonadota bacterium]
MQAELADKENRLEILRAENDALETDIARLMPGQVDADLVEYLARRELGFVYSDEVILTTGSQSFANMNRR